MGACGPFDTQSFGNAGGRPSAMWQWHCESAPHDDVGLFIGENYICGRPSSVYSVLLRCSYRLALVLLKFLYYYILLAGLPGVARAITTAQPLPPPPAALPQFLTLPRPVPGRPRPTCKVSALYLENCANALRQTETERERQTDRDRDDPLYRYRYIEIPTIRYYNGEPTHEATDVELT